MPRPYARSDESTEVTQVADGGGQATSHRRILNDADLMTGTATAGGVTVCWAATSDVGNQRVVNEDAVLAMPPAFVVADGMGGHQAGDVASGLVVNRFSSFVEGELSDVDAVVAILDDVNESILVEGRRTVARSGMGTTAVGLLLVDNGERTSWLLFNVGDSRAYRLDEGHLEQLSVDHSYVQELVDAGQITAGSARTHPHRNVVTRALGVEDGPNPDIWLRVPHAGERFLLCSDGLSSEVDDGVIRRDLGAGSVQDAAHQLVQSALAAGGHDNVTVLVVEVLEVGDQAAIEVTSPREGMPSRIADVPTEDPVRPTCPVGLRTDAELIDRVPQQDELADLATGDRDAAADQPDLDADDDVGRVSSVEGVPSVDDTEADDGEGTTT